MSRGLHLYSRGLRISSSPGAKQYFKRALSDFECVLSGDENDIFGHMTAARALHMLGRQREALKLYTKTLEMDPWSDGTAAEKRKALDDIRIEEEVVAETAQRAGAETDARVEEGSPRDDDSKK